MTVKDCIKAVAARLAASDVFFGHGTESPEDEAAWLVGYVAEGSDSSAELNKNALDELEPLLEQRITQKIPTAYLTGYTSFCGLNIRVNSNVLIPRSPIAELIHSGFTPWLIPDRNVKALDLCTGSGCIALAMAHHWPLWQVDGVDLSEPAITLAKRNGDANGLGDNVRFLQGDLFAPCDGERYDLIVTNPPYVSTLEYAILPQEYSAEPALGLVAGDDGLDIVYRILDQAADHLSAAGILICEVGHSQDTLVAQMPNAPFLWFDFEQGGQGVFMLDREQLESMGDLVQQKLSERSHVE